MKIFHACICAFVVVGMGDFCSAQQTQKADSPSPREVAIAVDDLKNSKDPVKWVRAAAVITRSPDKGAQLALRTFLLDPNVISTLKVKKTGPLDEFASRRRSWPEYTSILESIARGIGGEDALLWLLTQKPYDNPNTGHTPAELGADVLFDSFQYVQEPSDKLLALCADKLADSDTNNTHRRSLMNALAAWGTDESLKLYQKYAAFDGTPELLIFHRDKIVTLKILIKQLRALDMVTAGPFIDDLSNDVSMNTIEQSKLPEFAHDAKSAAAVADALDEFLNDSGRARPTAKQRDAISAIVTKLRAAAAQ